MEPPVSLCAFEQAEVNDAVVRYLDDVLLEWVDLAAPPSTAPPSAEMLQLEDIQRAVKHIADSANQSGGEGALLISARERPVKLLVCFNMRFARAQRQQERKRLFHVICFFLRLMQDRIPTHRPAIIRGM